MKQQEIRSGSALVVVLGMMAILMIMAVAFSVFMRTERSGMTNLKHALTARQTAHTAISRVMAAIDQSFVNPTNNWPVPEWDPPYISSWNNSVGSTQFWQNAQISAPAARANNARLLTDELSRHLSPSQLALAKNAKVDWVSVFSGIGASEATTDYGPKNDMIVARYAFLAFNTTGLLDMNFGPTTNITSVTEAQAINYTSFVKKVPGTGTKYITTRDTMGGFSSYAELWRAFKGNTRYDYDDVGGNDLEAGNIVTPDLFNTFSMSLDEVDPDGKMKLYIPKDTTTTTFTDPKKTAYAKMAVEKFKRLFKDENAYLKAASNGNLTNVLISSSPLPVLTRAELATQALIDYIDEDNKPSGGIWLGAGADPLNYPCTEAVPMVTQAFAYTDVIGPTTVETDPDPKKWYQEYTVTLNVFCRAEYLGINPIQGTYSLQGDFELVSFADDFTELWTLPTGTHPVEISPGVLVSNPAQLPPFCVKTALTPVVSGSSVFLASGSKRFKVRAKAIVDSSTGLVTGYHKFSKKEDAGDLKEVLSEVRISVKVVSGSDGPVQQVPAPALAALLVPQTDPFGNTTYKEDYRIRVDAGLNPPRSTGPKYKIGWAFCLDPRFAYNTKSLYSYPSGGYNFWLTGEMSNDTPPAFKPSNVSQAVLGAGVDYEPIRDVAKRLNDLELADNILPGGSDQRNKMVDNVIFRNFAADKLSASDAQKLMNAFTGRQRTYPDMFHSEQKGGTAKMFIDNGEDKTAAMPFRITNKPIKSMSEFGNLVIGPWETLSLFATFGPTGEKIDFHRVSDYFGFNEARYPNETQIPPGGIDALNTVDDEYLPALHYGKLNLNAQFKVKCDSLVAGSGIPDTEYNSEPLAAVLSGVPVNAAGFPMLSFNSAQLVAESFYSEAAESGASTETSLMFRHVSDLGNVNVSSNSSPVLAAVMAVGSSKSDADREIFIGGALDRLTTRGQTYLVIIRADAYTPKYGSTSAQGGTTLATEYALVELWRDSEPNRMPNGAYFPPGTTTPVHSWVIRSCRFFSP